jgi:hypothetical protein
MPLSTEQTSAVFGIITHVHLSARARTGCAWVLVLAAAAISTHAQSPSRPFDIGTQPTNNRVLNVTVLDANDRPVTGLAAADFRVFDDGKPQTIVAFAPTLPPDKSRSPSSTLIIFDLLNSVFGQRENTTTLITHALQPLEAADTVFVYLVTNRGELFPVHAFSASQPRVVTSQDASNQNSTAPPWTRQIQPILDQAIEKVNALGIKEYQDAGVRASATFFALNEIGNSFTMLPGPKAIVWLTLGSPNWLDYPYGCKDVEFPVPTGVYIGGRCGNDCTTGAGVSHCVDYTPFLQHFAGSLVLTDTTFSSVLVNTLGQIIPSRRGTPRDTLQQLADLTGGRVYLNGAVDKGITQTLQDVRARYQLAYDPPAPNGKFHKVRVECLQDGARVEAPTGYYAEKSNKK